MMACKRESLLGMNNKFHGKSCAGADLRDGVQQCPDWSISACGGGLLGKKTCKRGGESGTNGSAPRIRRDFFRVRHAASDMALGPIFSHRLFIRGSTSVHLLANNYVDSTVLRTTP